MNCGRKKMNQGGKVPPDAENDRLAMESMNEKRKSDEATLNRGNRGPTTRGGYRGGKPQKSYADGGDVKKKLSEMTDEERYGKVGAEIRRLDPEAYKKRSRTAEGNVALLKELRARAKGGEKAEPEAPKATRVEAAQESMRTGKPIADAPASSAPPQSGGGPRRGGNRNPPKSGGATRASRPRPPEMVSRREFGSDRRGAGSKPPSDAQLNAALTAASFIPFVGPGIRLARGANAAYKGYKATKASMAAAKATKDRVLRPNAAETLAEGRRIANEYSRGTPRRAKKIGSGRTTNKNSGGSIKKYAAGGAVTRGDGISRVKTRCRIR